MTDQYDPVGQLMGLIDEGKAEEILTAWSDHSQSCSMIYGIVLDAANGVVDVGTAQDFARNLLDDWGK